MTTDADVDTAMAEAIEWIIVFTSHDVTDGEVSAFHRWREEREVNGRVYAEIARLRPPLRDAAARYDKGAAVSRRGLLAGAGTIAAAVGAVGFIRPPLGLWPSLAEVMADYRTGVGERYAFAPSPGVRVQMNSRSSLKLLDQGAGVSLVEGEAFITVQRPAGFRIIAGRAELAAAEAELNIETLDDVVRVSCLSGSVRCGTGDRRIDIGRGEQVSFASDGTMARERRSTTAIGSWCKGMLVFEGTPLREVIAQLNRYRSGAIVLTDNGKRDRPVSAVFFTDQMDSALGQLERLLALTARSLPGGVVLIS